MSGGPVGPAMTPEEWADKACTRLRWPSGVSFTVALSDDPELAGTLFIGEHRQNAGTEAPIFQSERHALAALALHGQDFGFSHEDVDLLHDASADCGYHTAERLQNLADRIEALLPPELDA